MDFDDWFKWETMIEKGLVVEMLVDIGTILRIDY